MEKVKIHRIVAGELQSNCYIVQNGGRGFIVDAAGDADKLEDKIRELGLKIEAVLLTHGHFDHCSLAKHFQDKGIPIYIHKADADKLHSYKNMAVFMNFHFDKLTADVLLNGGEELNIAGLRVGVIHTPGHSEGGVCYALDGVIFTGDTIFKLSYGRTDFFDGDFYVLKESIQKVFLLAGDFALLTGHGETSTLQFERANNPILIDEDD